MVVVALLPDDVSIRKIGVPDVDVAIVQENGVLSFIVDVDCAPKLNIAPGLVEAPVESTDSNVTVEEPIAKAGVLAPIPFGFTESCAQGVVVPIPRNPALVNVDVPVPPKYAVYAERSVVDAFANVWSAVQLFGLAMFSDNVPDTPPSSDPNVPEYESDDPAVTVDVATVFSVPLDADV